MWLPTDPDKTPRFFQPCPSNDEYQLEPGMIGIKDVGNDGEVWVRPPRVSSGDAEPDPVRVCLISDLVHANLTSPNGVADYQHYPATIDALTKYLQISDGLKTGSTDKFKVGFRDFTQVQSSADLGNYGVVYMAVDDCDLYGISGAGVIYKINRKSLTITDSATVYTGNAPIVCVGPFVAMGLSTGIRLINKSDLSYTDVSGTIGSIWDLVYNGTNLYTVNSIDELKIISGTSFTVTTTQALASVTNRVYGLEVDSTGTYAYGIDADTAAASYSVKKWLIADGSLVATSPTLSLALNSVFNLNLFLHESELYIKYASSTGSVSKMRIADPSDLSTVYDGTSTVTVGFPAMYNGVLYGPYYSGSSLFIRVATVPAEYIDLPANTKTTGAMVSSLFLINGRYYTIADFAQNTHDVCSLLDTVGGISVLSVESSLPGSPTAGDWYLMDNTAGAIANMLAEYRAVEGWKFYRLNDGNTVFNIENQEYLRYVDDGVFAGITPSTIANTTINGPIKAHSEGTIGTEFGGVDVVAVFTGETNTTDATADSAVLSLHAGDPTKFYTREAGDMHVFDVMIIAAADDASAGRNEGAWTGVIRASAWLGASGPTPFIYGSLTAHNLVNTSATFTTPTIAFNTSNQLEITCEHTGTGANTINVRWQAFIKCSVLKDCETTC